MACISLNRSSPQESVCAGFLFYPAIFFSGRPWKVSWVGLPVPLNWPFETLTIMRGEGFILNYNRKIFSSPIKMLHSNPFSKIMSLIRGSLNGTPADGYSTPSRISSLSVSLLFIFVPKIIS